MRARSRNVDSELHLELHVARCVTGSCHVTHDFTGGQHPHERPLPGLHAVPDRQAAGQEPRACRTPRSSTGTSRARRSSTAPSWSAAAGGSPSRSPGILDLLGIASTQAQPRRARRYKGLVFDATGLTASTRPRPRCATSSPRCCAASRRCPHVVVLGTPPEQVKGAERVAQRALEGFTRSLGKEIGRGGTVQLVYVAEGAEAAVDQHAGVPALPQVGVRLRPGGPDRRPRHEEGARGHRLDQAARRQGRAGHRREPRHRRADRPGAAPRRRDRRRRRRTAGRQRAADPDEGARRRLDHPRHHRQGRAAADRAPPEGEARRRRRRRPQRRHHPRQEARQHGRGPLGVGDRGQPDRSRADHPRAARPGRDQQGRLDRRRRLASPASPATSGRPTTPPPRPA